MLNKSEMGWVDFSSEDRDRVRDVIKQLSEPGTLDELGIGALRDGFADLMFPGFSTIQTRAKYLITIPRIIRDYLALKPAQQRKQSPQQYLEQQENQLARALTLQHQNEGVTGIIGSTMKEGESVDWRKVRQAGPEQVLQWLAATKITLQGRTGAFLMEWSERLANNASVVVLDALVEKQALGNKKERSILKKRLPDNYRWIGMSRLDFRWAQVRTILRDIQEGLPC